MKKLTALIFALIFLLSLAGCSRYTADEPLPDALPNVWGVTLEAENVTRKGLTILCHHSGGKDVTNLLSGSYFVIQKSEGADWVDVDYIIQDSSISWTDIGLIIEKESTTTWEVNWQQLYGKLPAGKYRIGKEIMNLRAPGDYDTELLYAYFIIT